MAKYSVADAQLIFPNLQKDLGINIFKEIQTFVKKRSANIVDRIRSRIKNTVQFQIENSPEYLAVQNGILRGELGLPDASAIQRITSIWINNISVKFSQSANNFGAFTIGIIQSDYNDVLSSSDASFSYSSTFTSGTIEWLRWLLLEGTNILVTSYDFVPSSKGRTGMGTMVYSQTGSWTIPSEYAGISSDNFVLRALSEIDQNFEVIIRQELTKGLK